ncbi:hypothetical protein KY346_03060 [Candidatus Woesearchaeota archaeon]|nr:hypothetical protein [Candidatus Woesearchaeota archaeon]
MKKRAVQLSVQTMIIVALGLIVLLVLIFLIRGQIQKGAGQYFDIGTKIGKEAELEKCQGGFFTTKQCATNCIKDPKLDENYYWEDIGPKDCKAPTPVCCQRGDKKASIK